MDGAEVLCMTMAVVGTDVYYDWASDLYERQTFFKVSTPSIKTSISSETTSPEPIMYSTSEELTSSLTTTELETSPSERTILPEIPEFESIPVLVAIPILIWLRTTNVTRIINIFTFFLDFVLECAVWMMVVSVIF